MWGSIRFSTISQGKTNTMCNLRPSKRHLNDTQTATPEIQLLWHASSHPKTIRFNAANREELQFRCPLYSGHRNCSSSLFAALKRMVLGWEDACHSSWISGVAVWVSFRCRLDGRKLHIVFVFPCEIVLNRILPHIK